MPHLQRIIDSRHFQELLAYDRLCGIPRPWLQTATICEAVAMAAGTKKRNNQPFTKADFMKVPPQQAMPLEQVERIARQTARRTL